VFRSPQPEHVAFSGLITCGNCGGSVGGEIKKQHYVYYHCTGSAALREEVLEQKFTDIG
jgi:site-specific DNA recombinase